MKKYRLILKSRFHNNNKNKIKEIKIINYIKIAIVYLRFLIQKINLLFI